MKIKKLIISLIFILSICLISIKPKANEYINIQVISNNNIDDLIDEDIQNNWNINQVLFAKYNYGDTEQYILNLYSTTTNNNIIYITEKYTNATTLELEDDAEYYIYNNDLKPLLQALNETKRQELNYNRTPIYYINYNYNNSIGYWNANIINSNPTIYIYDYDTYYSDYMYNFGMLNTIYYNYRFYQNILSYYNNLIVENGLNYWNNGYNIAKEYYENAIDEQKQIYDALLEETKTEYYNRGREYEASLHPQDDQEASLYEMLKNVSMYPVLVFTEGLDVNIFGINIGNFALGIFMITFLIIIGRAVIGMFSSKGDK